MLDILNYFLGIEFFSFENIVLLGLGLFWLVFASVQDFKLREVENWWSFSLIVLVLVFRAFFSLENGSWSFFLWGLVGLAVGFVLSELFYYSRIFAGGDAKLLMALGPILLLGSNWQTNLALVLLFIILFIFAGGIYGIIYTIFMVFLNFKAFKKEFSKQFIKNKRIIYASEAFSIILFFVCYYFGFFMGEILCLILFLCPLLFIYAKAVEESCMNKLVSVGELTIGDWLVKPVKVGKRIIKPNWEGLSERELEIIQKNYKGKVLVRNGIPFVPAFLVALVLMIVLFYIIV